MFSPVTKISVALVTDDASIDFSVNSVAEILYDLVRYPSFANVEECDLLAVVYPAVSSDNPVSVFFPVTKILVPLVT